MNRRTGPSYQEWVEVLDHSKLASYDELHAIAKRISDSKVTPMTGGQRARLLRRIGDLQVTALKRAHPVGSHHDLRTGPAMS